MSLHAPSRMAPVTPVPETPSTRRRGIRRIEPRAVSIRRRAGLVLLAVLFVGPLIPVLGWGFAERWPYPDVTPTRWGLGGWAAAWGQGAGVAVARSLGLGLLVAAIATPAGVAAGRALAMGRVRFPRLVTAVLLIPVAVPPFAVVMGLGTVSLRARVPGLVAVIAVLVVAAIPYTTYIMRAAYASYDTAYEDTARTLGARRRDVLRRVHLPLLAPAITASAFLAFLVAWSDYVVTLVLGAGRTVTLPLLLGASAAGSGNDSTVAVLAILAVVPPTLLLLTVTRFTRRKGPS